MKSESASYKAAGVDICVAGSSVFRAADYAQAIAVLK